MRNNCGENAFLAAAWFCTWAILGGMSIGIAALAGAAVGTTKDEELRNNDPKLPFDYEKYSGEYAKNAAIGTSVVVAVITVVMLLVAFIYYRCKGNSNSAGEQRQLMSPNDLEQAKAVASRRTGNCCSELFSRTDKCLRYVFTGEEPAAEDEFPLGEIPGSDL